LEISDDAAVYKINDSTALIHTLDFFTPIVDDPYDFGAIAAANALSDIYAMGGRVLLALNILAFPKELSEEFVSLILLGGANKVKEAGGVLAGGHSISDQEPKYGLSVLGIVPPDKILIKGGAKPGEVLFLTKPLGGGIIATANKAEMAEQAHIEESVRWMKLLNKGAAEIISRFSIKCCTDVTGFALLGHLSEVAEKSGVGIRIKTSSVPFHPGAFGYAEQQFFPAGSFRNRCAYQKTVEKDSRISEDLELLLYTPETSGGLVFTVPRESVPSVYEAFKQAGEPLWEIGETTDSSGIRLTL